MSFVICCWSKIKKLTTKAFFPPDLKETRGRGDTETRREGLSCMVVKKFFHRNCLLPSAFCLLPPAFCLLPPASCLLPPASCLLPSFLNY
ncbi:MAG: hypothetical protein F6K41_30425 [Symploca sp. SIO3E6]|nr:hypothetical protein [Caldora sp. SIO3E6]